MSTILIENQPQQWVRKEGDELALEIHNKTDQTRVIAENIARGWEDHRENVSAVQTIASDLAPHGGVVAYRTFDPTKYSEVGAFGMVDHRSLAAPRRRIIISKYAGPASGEVSFGKDTHSNGGLSPDTALEIATALTPDYANGESAESKPANGYVLDTRVTTPGDITVSQRESLARAGLSYQTISNEGVVVSTSVSIRVPTGERIPRLAVKKAVDVLGTQVPGRASGLKPHFRPQVAKAA